MTPTPSVRDNLRIERAVWTMDARLQDLPRRSRIAKRHELRQNLRAAAEQSDARHAVRQLGDLRDFAADYLAAEYGDMARRPSWTAAALWIALTELVMLGLDHVASTAFRAGVTATTAHPTGTFHWSGIPYVTSDSTLTYLNGTATTLGGAWTPWVYLVMIGGAVPAGRLWRLVPTLRRHARRDAVPAGQVPDARTRRRD